MIKKTTIWFTISSVCLLVMIATMLITARLLLPSISAYNVEISEYLSEKLNAKISIGNIQPQWERASPELILSNIRIVDHNYADRVISISKIQAELDLLQSIKSFAPVFRQLSIDQFSVQAEQEGNRWLTVFSPKVVSNLPRENAVTEADNIALNRLLKVLSKQSLVKFTQSQLILKPQGKPVRTVGPMLLLMENTKDQHQLSGRVDLKHYGDISSVSFAIKAEQLSEQIIRTPFQVHANFKNISEQLMELNLVDLGVKIKQMSVDSQVWATVHNGAVSDVVGTLAINTLKFEKKVYPQLTDSHLTFAYEQQQHRHLLRLSDIDLYDGKARIKIPQATATYFRGETEYLEKVAISKINLTQLTKELAGQSALNDKLKDLVDKLNLQGELNNFVLEWKSSDLKDFLLKADLNKVSLKSYSGAPALSGVSGLLQMSLLSGQIDVETTDFSMRFPKLFPKPWRYKQAQGKVNWQVETLAGENVKLLVKSDLISLKKDKMAINGRFSLVIPFDKKLQTELILMLGARQSAIKNILAYLPENMIGQPLSKWINTAALEGTVEEAGFVLRTGFRDAPALTYSPSVQMYFNFANAQIKFDQNWPNFFAQDLHLSVTDGDVLVTSQKGEIAGNQVANLLVTKENQTPELIVGSAVTGDIGRLFSKLGQKSAISYFPAQIKHWQLSGRHSTTLNLTIPLSLASKPPRKAVIKVVSELKNANLKDNQYQLALSDINGKLIFDSQTGLQSNAISATSFGNPSTLNIVTDVIEKGLKTSIALNSSIQIKDLAKQVNNSQLDSVSGKAKFNARLDICPNQPSCNQLVVNSQLEGVTIDLPKPWGKTKDQTRKLQLVSKSSEKSTLLRFNYADIVRGITELPKAEDAKPSTSIVLGGAKPSLAKNPGIYLAGSLKNINLDVLVSSLSGLSVKQPQVKVQKSAQSQQSAMDSLKRVELKLNNVTLLGRKLNNSWLSFQQSNTQWLGKFNTSIATGQVVIPHNRNKTVSLKLDSLSINPADNLSMKPATKHKSTKLINTQQWPKVELLIEQLTLNKLNIGQWSAFLAPTISGYKASDIRGKIATTNISGEVGWAKQKSEVRSFFDVQAKGGDFGFALKQLGYAQVLENKSGDLDAKLSWSGYPWDFEQGNLNGRASFKLLKGRIIEAGTSANFLRIFGILNLNSVIKRLQLDFSDLLKSGVAFDSVTGKYSLQNGVATSQEPLKLQGDAASIEMAGSINLSQQTLDQKMIVAIPLSSNAPIAALLLATPQVAGIAFVVDKLIGKRLAKLTALRYSVSGSWFEPTIQTVTVANTGGSEPEPTNNN